MFQLKEKIIDLGWDNESFRKRRASIIVGRIFPFLINAGKIIDIGCGECYIASFLKKKGKEITGVDIAARSEVGDIKVILYDGKKLPFKNKEYDVALLLTVLHHTPDPNIIFLEAARVAEKIIIIEDIHTNIIQKILNVLIDSWQNKPLRFFWDSYKSDNKWRKFFQNHGFKISHVNYYQDMPYLHAVYFLEKEKN